MENPDTFKQILEQCNLKIQQKRYGEALKLALQLLHLDAENLGTHKLLATLYGLNNQHIKAHMHYILLAQYDATYTTEHCLQVAKGYAAMRQFKAAALICVAAANRIKSKRLLQHAAVYYEAAGEKAEAEKIRSKLR